MKHKEYWLKWRKLTKTHTRTPNTQRKITLKMVSKYENNWYLLFLKTTPYFTNPSFFTGKISTPPSPLSLHLFAKISKTQPPFPPLFCLSVINETGGVQLCNSFVFLIKKRGIRSNFISTNAWKVCALFSSLLFYVINAFLL